MVEIDKKGILTFLNKTIDFVVCDMCCDTKEIERLFCFYIDDNCCNFHAFFNGLDKIKQDLKDDLAFFLDSDPAVDSKEEVVLAYPGYKAIIYYRIAHALHNLNIYLPSRVISEEAHFLTGIDIHPGAKIDCPFFIDHGTGIVIGETSIVGHHVKMYQGVTLGALSLTNGARLKGIKRHPTIKNYVTIYSNASILGDVTIGNNVTIGGNVFLTESINDNTKVVISKPELVIIQK